MWQKIWNWLFPHKTTASVMADFHGVVAKLDVVADAHEAIAAAHEEIIQNAAIVKAAAVSEVAKATAIGDKLKALLS